VALRDVSEKRAAETALREAQERYRHLAEHDELTGLANRRKFEAELDRHFDGSHAPRGGLLYIDLDHFKEVNDTLGHRAGDQLLTQVAHAMSERMPEDGVLSRQGGDEFLVLLPRGGADEALALAEELRDAVRQVSLTFEEGDFKVSASIGVVTVDQIPRNEEPGTAALICADIALYNAKTAGRDQVALYERNRTSTQK
jgi:diguanylate cyclase (GGDEF)-like protein